MNRIIALNTLIITIIAFAWWCDYHTKALMLAADRYEHCIEETYGVTASNYYQSSGEYPECVK